MDEQEIRKRVEKRLKQKNEFFVHLAIYIAVNLMLWVIYFLVTDLPQSVRVAGDLPFPFPLIVMMGWGIGLVSHGLSVYFNSANQAEARERAIQREIERERERMEAIYESEKPKRDSHYRLSDDGEILSH